MTVEEAKHLYGPEYRPGMEDRQPDVHDFKPSTESFPTYEECLAILAADREEEEED